MSFTHLHAHSHFSLLEGTSAPAALVARAVQCHLPALALTDHNGLYGIIPFYQAAQAAGIQPLLGLELDLVTGDRLVLLAQNAEGYRNLCRLSSAVLLQPPCGGVRPGAPLELLRAHHGGLLALSGGRSSLLAQYARAEQWHQASRLIGLYSALFGPDNSFVEGVIHESADVAVVGELVGLAAELGVPVVAANDALGVTAEEMSTAALLDAIRTRTTLAAPHPAKAAHPERYLKTAAQMSELFADWPEALAHTGYIARRCQVELPLGTRRFPGVTLKPGETAFSQLYKLAQAGAARRYQPLTPAVTARLQTELQTIEQLGFAPYFLIVADIVRWCRRQGIPAMGRGSAADSLVAYVLDITPVDPLAHDLYFERFLNAERTEPPDIDLDLCWRRRDEVLNYVYETYGSDHVAMIGTHIRFQLRSAWRDVARAHGCPAADEQALQGRPWGYRLAEAQAEARAADPTWGPIYPLAAEANLDAPADTLPPLDPTLLAASAALDGQPRHLGIHCAGLVIAPFPITDEVPLQRATKGLAVTQYEMEAIAALGLVKIDLLGSRALSALRQTAARVRLGGQPLDLESIPWDDPATLTMLGAGRTLGCFQLESPGMRSLLQTMQPRCLNDIIAAVSLFRPGPLAGGLKDACLARLRDGSQPAYAHPAMAQVLGETHGVILYQEQFLWLVHELAGFSLAGAESLRKALARHPDEEEQAALRARFVAGAIGHDIAQPVAEQLWETLVGYSGFGFCKGHAAAYAVIAYRTAYCKAHYPAELLAAVLSNQAGFYPPQVYIEEARRLGIRLRPPDINRSAAGTRAREGTIQLGLGAVRGVCRATVQALLAARREGGPFRSLRELLGRVALSKGELTALIQVGALGRVAGGRSRAELLWQARLWLPAAAQAQAGQRPNGQAALPLPEALPDLPATMPALRPYSLGERLGLEYATLGVALSANPLLPYREQLARHGAVPAAEVAAHAGESIVVGGVPVALRRHALRPGTWIGFLTVQDLSDLIEVVIGPEVLAAALPAVARGGPVLVRGVVERANHGGVTVRATRVRALGGRPPTDTRMAQM